MSELDLFFENKMNEECGVFGVFNHENAAELTYYGLHSLEHRSRVSNRFSSPRRMRCVQFPVVQFLKLSADHAGRCILR